MAKEFVLIPKRKYESMLRSMTEMEKARYLKDSQHQVGGQDVSQIQPVNSSDISESHEDKQDESQSKTKTIENKTESLKPLPRLYVKRPLSKMDFYQADTLKPKRKRKMTNEKTMWINYKI